MADEKPSKGSGDVGVAAAIVAAIIFVAGCAYLFLHVLGGYCAGRPLTEKPLSYTLTIRGESRVEYATPDKDAPRGRAPIAKGSQDKAQGRAQPDYEPDSQPSAWWVKFWCEVNGSDFFIALFTLVLAIVTGFLWFATHRLWKAGEGQIAAATKTAEAAIAANKISEAAQRAWIAIESVKLIPPIDIPNLDRVPNPDDENARRTRLIIQVALRNIGRSPASQLKVLCKLASISRELDPYVPVRLRDFGPLRSAGGSVLLPRDPEIRTFEFWGPLPRHYFVDVPTPNLRIDVEVCASYRITTDTDIHQTQFAYRDVLAATGFPQTDEISLTRNGERDRDPT
jgi:hypothetical protein